MPFVKPSTPPPPPSPATTRPKAHRTDEPGPSTSISSKFPPSSSAGSTISLGGSSHLGSSSSLQGSVAGNTGHTDPIPPSLPPAGSKVRALSDDLFSQHIKDNFGIKNLSIDIPENAPMPIWKDGVFYIKTKDTVFPVRTSPFSTYGEIWEIYSPSNPKKPGRTIKFVSGTWKPNNNTGLQRGAPKHSRLLQEHSRFIDYAVIPDGNYKPLEGENPPGLYQMEASGKLLLKDGGLYFQVKKEVTTDPKTGQSVTEYFFQNPKTTITWDKLIPGDGINPWRAEDSGPSTSLHKIVEQDIILIQAMVTQLDNLRLEVNDQFHKFQTLVDNIRSKNPLTTTPEEVTGLRDYISKFRTYSEDILTYREMLDTTDSQLNGKYHTLAIMSDDKDSISAISNYANEFKYKKSNNSSSIVSISKRIDKILESADNILKAPVSKEAGGYATAPNVP